MWKEFESIMTAITTTGIMTIQKFIFLGQAKAGKNFVYILETYEGIIQASMTKKIKLGWGAAVQIYLRSEMVIVK